jgi:two-component system, OmpR family, sensor kinase
MTTMTTTMTTMTTTMTMTRSMMSTVTRSMMSMMSTTTTEPAVRRRRWWSSIRVRIVVGYVLLLAAALAISILVTRQVLVARLDQEIDRALAQEVEELRSLATGNDPATGEPFGSDVRAILDTFLRRNVPAANEAFYSLVDGERFLSSFAAPQEVWEDDSLVRTWAAAQAPTQSTVQSSIGEVRYLAVPLISGDATAGVFVVAHFPGPDRDEILLVVRILTIAGLVVLVASAALAGSLAGRVLRPVRELTATAQRITDTDLTQRIEVDGRDELAELGDTFNDMVGRLERGFAQQRRFLDDVAHELRTPITIVQGHVDLLGDDPDERAESIATIDDELDRMNRYVNDLLLLAKAESGEFLQLGPVDLGELATTIEQRVRRLGDREWVLDGAPPPGTVAILGDRDRLVQALLNLATNAIQHTGPGDRIALGIAAAGERARLWVRDTGPGLDDDTIDQLFDRRFRGAASRTRRTEGMGIGLSIVDAIARGHGGRASAANEPGGGARFTIELPIDPAPEDLP